MQHIGMKRDFPMPFSQASRTRPALRRYEHAPRASTATATILLLFYLVIFFVMPHELPGFVQRMTALTGSVLAGMFVFFAVREFSDRPSERHRWIVRTKFGEIAGVLVFACVFAWWLSDRGPIQVHRFRRSELPNTRANASAPSNSADTRAAPTPAK